jgi:hypothetical protein
LAVAVRRRGRSGGALFPGFVDISEIGAGSLATVYRAREADTGRAVALKLLSVRDVSPRALESFQRESIALGAVSAHPNIVTLYRSFQTPDGRPVLVLELCIGSIFDEFRTPGGLSTQRVVSLGVKMAAALETAHRAEILHRDVKPQNILITEFGEPALADFGVAMLQATSQTTSGLFDFTTLHVAPELLEGRATSPATDVYELASTLYQLVAGQSAFRAYEGESPASVILRILRDPVRPLVSADVPAALSDLLVASMAKEQQARPPTAAEFAASLGEIERSAGWPETTFLVRDAPNRLAAGGSPMAVPAPVVAQGRPAFGAHSTPSIAVRPIAPGPRLDAPIGVPAGGRPIIAPAPLGPVPTGSGTPAHRPEPLADAPVPVFAEPAAELPRIESGGLTHVCQQGHLVSAALRFCPICGSSVVVESSAAEQPAERTHKRRVAPGFAVPAGHDPWQPAGEESAADATRVHVTSPNLLDHRGRDRPPAPITNVVDRPTLDAARAAYPPLAGSDSRTERGDSGLAELPMQWGAVRLNAADGPTTAIGAGPAPASGPPVPIRVTGLHWAGAPVWLGLGAIVAGTGVGVGGAIAGIGPVIAAVLGAAVLVVGLAVAGVQARVRLVGDGAGLHITGVSGSGPIGWPDIAGVEVVRAPDPGKGWLVLHTRTGPVSLERATTMAYERVEQLAGAIDRWRVLPGSGPAAFAPEPGPR